MKMKDKKAEQEALKQAHKLRLQEAKNRRSTPNFEIPPPTRLEKQRFLIVCEGLNTEPDYFRIFRQSFKLANADIVEIGGAGETIRVVERAQAESKKSSYDQVWVVFDKDDFPAANFDNAIVMAQAAGFFSAYSNQAFEYWLILHFEDHQGGAMHRDQYGEKLNQYLAPFNIEFDASGNKRISAALFQVLMSKDAKIGKNRMDLAIERAKKVLQFHEETPPSIAESSTTVFKLIEELLKFIN
ncbi:MAG: RloB domain-containing protein [Saprospiraceae bacterium]|nr:RloB domain-containing protein [Saprospiraceae bacterium]